MPWVVELSRIRQLDHVDLPTGLWPQLSQPADLAATTVAIISAG